MARLSSPSGVAHPHENDYTGAERQSARMSKITNDGLIQCGTGCFIAGEELVGIVHLVTPS